MRRTIILLLVFLLLGGIYFYMNSQGEEKSSIRVEDREFILKNPDDVSVITIEQKGRPAIHLSKAKGVWLINDRHKANQRIVLNMLSTMKNMSIKYIPTILENEEAQKRMAKHGIDIKTYDSSGKIITDFILGTNTNTEYGTYCMKRGAKQAYVMSLSVTEGGIRNYFTQTQEEMRSMNVFTYETNDLRRITVEYPKDITSSYTVWRDGVEYKFSENGTVKECHQNLTDAYFSDFKKMNSVFVRNDHFLKDTILSFIPFMVLTIEAQNKPELSMKVYPLLDMENSNVNTRSPRDITKLHEKFFVYTSQEDFYMVQGQFIKRYMKRPSYFYEKTE